MLLWVVLQQQIHLLCILKNERIQYYIKASSREIRPIIMFFQDNYVINQVILKYANMLRVDNLKEGPVQYNKVKKKTTP